MLSHRESKTQPACLLARLTLLSIANHFHYFLFKHHNNNVHTHTHTPQDKLWSGLKELADGIMTSTTAVWHLQRVVAKKKVWGEHLQAGAFLSGAIQL
jgi:hypothetical protein